MKDKKAKLFWKKGAVPKKICLIMLDENLDYLNFVKKQHEIGWRQVIITSEVMINLIEKLKEDNLDLYDIEFMEDYESEIKNEIKDYIDLMKKEKSYFSIILKELYFLSERSSIEIKRIYFKGRNENNSVVRCFVQSNGIISVNDSSYNYISEKIRRIVEELLFK